MPGKLYIKTFGCQMNEYDSSRMLDVLSDSHGLTATDDPSQADVLLLNTCSVREKAQEKVFSQLGRWKDWKAERPDLIIGVGGLLLARLRRIPKVGEYVVEAGYRFTVVEATERAIVKLRVELEGAAGRPDSPA